MLAALAAGVVIGWLTAPRRGGWYRNQARQKLGRWTRWSVRRLGKRGRDASNRLRGTLAQARESAGHEHYVDANTLVDQVRSRLGRGFASTLEHVNLNAVGHTLYLHGYVNGLEERRRLIDAIRQVAGVDAVAAGELRVEPEAQEA